MRSANDVKIEKTCLRTQSSKLNDIYLEQWEKNNNLSILEQKVKQTHQQSSDVLSVPKICSNQLSQVYFAHWENNGNVKIMEKNVKQLSGKISKKDNESKDQASVYSESQQTFSIEDKPAVSLNFVGRPNRKDKSNYRNIIIDHKVEDLTAEITNLKKNLKHCRKRNRELFKELWEERERNKIRKEDLIKIRTLLNKYI